MTDSRLDGIYSRLTRSARDAIQDAEGIRRAAGRDKVHMELLVLALYDRTGGPVHRALEQAKVDRRGLLDLLAQGKDGPLPDRYTRGDLQVMPVLSSHARKAVLAADRIANEAKAQSIGVTHLVQGVLGVRDCHVVKRLARFDFPPLASDDDASQDPSWLRKGSAGDAVRELQHQLAELGLSPGTQDGVFGPATDQAVMAFQASVGLAPDGVVGPKMRAALERAWAARSVPADGSVLSVDGIERHVAQALESARQRSSDPITAGRALDGVLRTASSSEAFGKLRQLLAELGADLPATESPQVPDMGFSLSPEFGAAVARARGVGGRKTLWGRALVTAILFGPESLDGPFSGALDPAWREALQDRWATFLAENDSQWASAWTDAIAGIRKLGSTSTYLLTWNPAVFPFSDLDEHVAEVAGTGMTEFGWSLGSRKYVSDGDRVFLMRQETEPGLVGSGQITGPATNEPDFRPDQALTGKRYLRVPVRWDALSKRPILDLETLDQRLQHSRLWRSQTGGVRIAPDLAARLEALWLDAHRSSPEVTSQDTTDAVDSDLSSPRLGGLGAGIASIDPDRPSPGAVDHLGVENEAFAFARLAASRSTKLPLSIGVFGEWGSGKTFFMEKMRAHVARLETSARRAVSGKQPTAYHTAIVQITFNAWHYMETNLWASLVDHIFRELDKWLRAETPATSDEIEALYQRLSTSRMLKLEALEQLILARRRRHEAEHQVQVARQELAKAESESGTISIGAFWTAVKQALGADELHEAQRKKLEAAARSLGFVDVSNSAKGLMDALKEARDQAQGGRLLARSVVSRLSDRWWMSALVGLLVVTPLVAPPLVDWIVGLLAGEGEVVGQVAGAAATISATLAAATAWIGRAVASGKLALKQLGEFQRQLDTALKERKEPEPQAILQAEQVLAQRRSAVALAETTLEVATKELAQARSDFGQTAAVRLNRFIREKIVNGEYAKHLGIIANVRKDFEQLAAIMSDIQLEKGALDQFKAETQAYRAKIASLNVEQLAKDGLLTADELEGLNTEGLSSEQPRYFQRIILFIDDLDRCPPKTVVEVLQACHLLLSFPLFVVVVAVDARWVCGALLDQYEGLIADLSESAPSGMVARNGHGSASPRDYLEKIFQIPYWVRHMHSKARQDYTTFLVGAVLEPEPSEATRSETATPVPPAPPPPARRAAAVDGGKGSNDGSRSAELVSPPAEPVKQPPDPVEVDHTTSGTQGAPPPAEVGRALSLTEANLATPDARSGGPAEQPVDANPRSLLLSPHERDFLAELAQWAGESPRTIKRFVNVYRLLRTGLGDQELDALVGKNGESDKYRAIIGQLAIVTGAPTLADEYFEALGPPERQDGMTVAQLEAALKKPLRVRKSPEWKGIEGALRVLKNARDSEAMISAMRESAGVVKRYSFSARPYL
jgi:peptidoglycan hydrolase-like protein with peptidoglycan-binding domain